MLNNANYQWIMIKLGTIHKSIILTCRNPGISQQTKDKLNTAFKALLDDVIQLTSPLTIEREIYKLDPKNEI